MPKHAKKSGSKKPMPAKIAKKVGKKPMPGKKKGYGR